MLFDASNLKSWLTYDEGRELKEYPDSDGNPTIGIGHDIASNGWPYGIPKDRDLKNDGITDAECDTIFEHDIHGITYVLQGKMPWLFELDIVRQCALLNMAFNLGVIRFFEFTVFLALMSKGAFDAAAEDLEHTKVYSELTNRYIRICLFIRKGDAAMPV